MLELHQHIRTDTAEGDAELLRRLEELERAARPLEPDADARTRLRDAVVASSERFLGQIDTLKAYQETESPALGLLDAPIGEHGIDLDATIELLEREVVRPGGNPASPGHLAYIPGGGIYHAALGDYLAAVTNKYAGFFFTGPGPVRMENLLVRWAAELVGYPAAAAGHLASGGSLATLAAVATARDAHGLKAADFARAAVYLTAQAHHCIDKALHIAGRARSPKRIIATDESYRMSVEALEQALEEDRRNGIRPWIVIASAGTVDTGAIDPLPEIAELCRRYGAWLHVDGAYGGLFALCDEGKALLGGIEQADSVALDPHKTLFLPYGTGAALVRDGKLLQDAFNASGEYIRPLGESEVGPSPADLSPELTRHFRALRLWLPLQMAGIAAFRAAQAEKLALARYFHARLSELEGFDAGPEPQLSVVAFRYLPKTGDVDEFNERLMRHIQQEGRVMMSGTRIDGSYRLRCAILCFRTHLEHVDDAIDAVVRGVEALS